MNFKTTEDKMSIHAALTNELKDMVLKIRKMQQKIDRLSEMPDSIDQLSGTSDAQVLVTLKMKKKTDDKLHKYSETLGIPQKQLVEWILSRAWGHKDFFLVCPSCKAPCGLKRETGSTIITCPSCGKLYYTGK